ncbi:MAG: ABC transporter permease subunit [Chlamydiae bacterium]|nr:ABC transporter permease subunit [Chlamydiota bacterium]
MISVRNMGILMQKELVDVRHNRWFVVIAILFALLSLSLSLLGLSGLGTVGITGFGRTAASLLNLVLLIVPLMGLLLGAMSLVGEKEQGTLLTLLAQPVTLSEILLGKFFGGSLSILIAILLGFGASGLVIGRYAGTEQIVDYLILVGFTVLLGWTFLSIGFFISMWAKRHTMALGLALLFWFFFIFLSDLGLIGTTLVLKLSPGQMLGLILVNPVQSFKLAVAGSLQKSLESFGSVGMYAVQVFGNGLTIFLSGILVLWLVIPLLLSWIFFRSRCVD